MKINTFIINIYGRKLYAQIVFMMFLAFSVATAQFVATQHLGGIIDAVEKGYEETIYYFYIIAISLLIYIIGSGVFTFFNGKIIARFSRCMQTKIGIKICSAHYQSIEQIDDGELLTIITKDIESIRNWITMVLKSGFLPAYLGLVPIYLFRWCNWKFSLFVLCLIPLNAVTNVLISKKLPLFYNNEKKSYAKVLSLFTATIQFIMLIKAFQLEKTFQNKNKDELDRYIKTRKKRMLYEKFTEEYNRCYGHISRILILLLGAYFIFIGEMTLGRLTSVILLTDFVGEGLKILGNIPVCLQSAKVSVIRTRKLLELQDEDASEVRIQTVVQPNEMRVYEVRGLAFSYGSTAVLHDINFCVNQGEKIAVVGLSGCGKTTLFKLLSGLYTPKENQIYFKGMDIAGLSSEYLKNNITATTQESFLFQATFKDNIKVAKSDGSDAEIIAACKNAQIDSFIQTFAYGYDTEVNTTIQSISNGQMQRINLARAFLRNTNVFLLDEPTSALDSDTAKLVWNYLFLDCADKTLLVILHDLEVAYRFNKILVLDNGKMAGFGTHKELLQDCELYRKLYQEKLANRRKEKA